MVAALSLSGWIVQGVILCCMIALTLLGAGIALSDLVRAARVPLLFVLTGICHTELGMRSVIVDYIGHPLREWALIANTCAAVALGLACVYAVLRIGFV